MSIATTGQDAKERSQKLLHLALAGLLPEDQTLVVDPKTRTVSLLCLEAGVACIRTQVQFSVSEMAVLLPLLQSYPAYCPYEVLLSSLNACPLEECRDSLQAAQSGERELWLRPLRRAKESLADDVQQFGLEICSLRGIGYLLKPSSVCPSSSQHVGGSRSARRRVAVEQR